MAAPNTLTKELNALLTTTLENYRPTMADNIFRSNATWARLKANDALRRIDGGNRIVVPLMYGKNETVKSYSGYDKIDTSPQEGITAAEFYWRNLAGTVSISREERRKNSGKSELFNLVDKKIQQAERSIMQKVNNQLINAFTPGNNGKDLDPIHSIVPKDPSSGTNSSVGEIDGANESWWRNQNKSSSASTLDGMKRELRHMYNLCKRGAQKSAVDLVLMDQTTFEQYEASLDDQVRYNDTEMADMGFETLRLKGADVAWEEVMPDVDGDSTFNTDSNYDESSNPATGTAIFLNTDFIEVAIDKETEFVTGEFQEPTDQVAATSKILFMGNTVTSNRRKHGVLYGISRI